MSLLWDYEEKAHRIIAGRKRKKVQKRIVAAVNNGYEVESLTYSDGQYVALLVDSFSLDRARKKKMVEVAEEYTIRFKDEGFEHGLASAVHYIEGLQDLALGLSGPRLPSYDAYMDGFDQRETPLSDRVGAALTAIIKLECARIVGEAEAPKGPYRDRNRTRAQAGPHGELLAWYYGWYDAKGQEDNPDGGLKDNRHYMDGWNLFRKLETQAARRLEYQRNRERNGIGEVKNPPVTAAVSPVEVERARTENTDPGSEHPLIDPLPSEQLAPAAYISPALKEQLESQGYDPESPEGILYRQGWGWSEQGMTLAQNNKGAFYLGYRAYDEIVRASNPDQGWKTRYNPGKAPSDQMRDAIEKRSIPILSMDAWAYQNGWELAESGETFPDTDDTPFRNGYLDYLASNKPNGMPRSPEELKERVAEFEQKQKKRDQLHKNLVTPVESDDPVPPIPPPDLAPWLAFHNFVSGSKEERSYIHGWNRAAGGLNPIPPGIDEWNDRGYQDRQSNQPHLETDDYSLQGKVESLTSNTSPTFKDGIEMRKRDHYSKNAFHGAFSTLSKMNYENGWESALNGEEMRNGGATTYKWGHNDASALIREGKLTPNPTSDPDSQSPPPAAKDGGKSENPDHPNTAPPSPPATEEPAEDVPLLAAFGSYRARRNIPPRSGRGNYYRNGWCDAADALQVSLNIPDDPENGLRLAYLAGYNDYQEAVVMSKESA